MALHNPLLNLKPKWPLFEYQTKLSAIICSLAGLQGQTTVALTLLFLLFAGLGTSGPLEPARQPLLSGKPFIIFWGISDSSCSVRPDLESFGMEREGRVAVFYEDMLGSYPYFMDKDTRVNGGLPQHTRLDSHLQKTQIDLNAAVPTPRYLGLGILRWAEWFPQWLRNREKKAVYQEASRNLLKAFFPEWTPEEVEKWSQVDFEAAAQSVMMETLREIKQLRPKALWGISPYPSCFYGDSDQPEIANDSGQCPPAEMALNDELLWLWKQCSALYPLLTLEKLQGGTSAGKLYLSSQIQEALRVSSLTGLAFDLPVFPLVNSVYASTNTFLSQADLVSSIGESAAMGTAGVIIWQRSETKTERECQDLAEFIRKVLGPYSINITTATRLCSTALCEGKGRCVRQNPNSSTFLHLPPTPEVMKGEANKATDEPEPDAKATVPDPAEIWKKDFQCQWYKTTNQDVSDQQSDKDGESISRTYGQLSGDLGGISATFTTNSISKFASTDKQNGSAPAPMALNFCTILLSFVSTSLFVN
ncbi:glyco_hydro_56 domain-containing protein isoform X1 [Corythoichthys intestinalis]|uniref:glyco_hydro_56 domain-containing protein isoform X1 n=1 Tax=Corythoichthys intestinalis TaxID=161448 RepID=UPI0025A60B56|nr:glyco_hydro_56 domain-containing protein isoform X1 [Corythoichthys intestinalis]XP_057675038.1 glyco_hydro_56 domain-containing protein isoform X1 [Corythoichthys intestinalis]XP_061802236.1 hyaluronidase-2-like [Nerophis lumbriciformis]